VEGAETPDQVDGVDADDLAGGEAGGDDVEGAAVVGVVEGGDEDERVGDVEVGVAGGEALALEDDGRGHGEFDDLEGFAFVGAGRVAEGVEAREVFGEWEVVLVGGVGFDAGEDGGGFVFWGGDETGDVVDVAVGVVAGTAAREPEGLVDAEVVAEGAFEEALGCGFVAEAWVALLNFGEEALFGGEQNSRAVGVDGAAFEDDAVRFTTPTSKCARRGPRFPACRSGRWRRNFGLDLGEVVELGDAVGDLVVEMPVGVLGPGVELPVEDGEVFPITGAGGFFHEDRAGVAEPDAVGGPLVEVEAREIRAAALEDARGAALGGEIVDEDVDGFDGGEMANDLCVDPGDGLELAGPVVGIVRPCDPCGGVRGPLGGHAGLGGGHGATRVTRCKVRGSRARCAIGYSEGWRKSWRKNIPPISHPLFLRC